MEKETRGRDRSLTPKEGEWARSGAHELTGNAKLSLRWPVAARAFRNSRLVQRVNGLLCRDLNEGVGRNGATSRRRFTVS